MDATVHVLKVQIEIEAIPGKYYVKNSSDISLGDISGIIHINADHFQGNILVTIPEVTYLKFLSKMLGEEFSKIDSGNIDGLAELANMIFGLARISLNENGMGIKPAIPKAILSKDVQHYSASGPFLVLPFSTLHGNLYLEIGLFK
jgi:CheY-specific phosphatase CheX